MMSRKSRTLSLLTAFATSTALSLTLNWPVLAAGLPDLGEAAQADLSPRNEQRLGEDIMQEIRLKDPSYLDDPVLTDYLNSLGLRLTAAIDSSVRQKFSFFLLREPTINAFALPGGYIGVHSGLLLEAQSESELAGVLAHEISHVTQHHIARGSGVQSQSYAAMLAALAVAILAARSNPDVAQGALLAGQAGAIQNQLNYSREFEREADRLGIQLLGRAGFDIRGMAVFFQRLQRQSRLYESKNAPAYLQTHPLTTERIADMENRIFALPKKSVAEPLDFQLARARLRAQNSALPDAYSGFNETLRLRPEDIAARYGLALTYARDNRDKEAFLHIDGLQKEAVASPFIPLLAAQLRLKQDDTAGALALLRPALAAYPQSRALAYVMADALLSAAQPMQALDFIAAYVSAQPDDFQMRQLQAKSYAALGKKFEQHRAQGEAYALQGLLAQAVEQFELAQKAPDGDFFEHSKADARLNELKQKLRQRLKEKSLH